MFFALEAKNRPLSAKKVGAGFFSLASILPKTAKTTLNFGEYYKIVTALVIETY
jgi:hypothetical protein